MGTAPQGRKRLSLLLIKPSHYDDDGYVIQWLRSAIPSNTLACMYGLALDCKERRVLGDDVEIVIKALDETNTRIRPERIARQLGTKPGLVAMVGVQSNQFPRAMDIARPLRAAGIQVCIGGFHVSGCLAMLEEPTQELKQAMALANLLRDVTDNVYIFRVPADVAGNHKCHGPAHMNLHFLAQASAEFLEKLTDVIGIGLFHQAPRQRRVSNFVELLAADGRNALARRALSQPAIKARVAPVRPKGVDAVAHQEPAAIVKVGAPRLSADGIRQVVRIYLRTLAYELP